MRMLLSMMGVDALTDAAAEVDTLDRLPALGSRVRRGKDWKWGNQGNQTVGTVVELQPPGKHKVSLFRVSCFGIKRTPRLCTN